MKSKTKHLIGYTCTALVALGIGAAGGSGPASDSAGAGAAATVTRTVDAGAATVTAPATTVTMPAETVTATPEAPASASEEAGGGSSGSVPGDGTYEVGVDIQPGRYTSATPESGNCYWARLNGSDGIDGIIANNNSSGQSVVTIRASDKYFESSGCSEWVAR